MTINNKENRAKAFIYNSLLLTLSAILMRAVGVGYNVYISNRVGAEVMGLYSLVSNVWGGRNYGQPEEICNNSSKTVWKRRT